MRPCLKSLLLFAVLLSLLPLVVQAHAAGTMVTGWLDGFNHPLHGWDHLLAMLGVGWWAAQQRGALRWRLPLTFVAVMGVGGLVGFSGAELPGVEWVIGGSVLAFALLVVSRARLPPGTMMSLVASSRFSTVLPMARNCPARPVCCCSAQASRSPLCCYMALDFSPRVPCR